MISHGELNYRLIQERKEDPQGIILSQTSYT
jgi:hypothetical protein